MVLFMISKKSVGILSIWEEQENERKRKQKQKSKRKKKYN